MFIGLRFIFQSSASQEDDKCLCREVLKFFTSIYYIVIILIYFLADTLGMEGESVGRSLERKPSWLDVDPSTYGRSPSPDNAKRAFTKYV